MAETTERTGVSELLEDLEASHEAYERRRDRVDEIGENDLRELDGAYDRATSLLDRYEDRATGTGDFEAFVSFQSAFSEHVEDLPADLPERDAFERAAETLDKRRLAERDFENARETLTTVGETVARLDDREAARERYRNARRGVLGRRDELEERIEELERVQRYGRADLDAPIERLHDPIVAYDEAVNEAFDRFRREAGARTVLSFVATTKAYPLVAFRQPPDDLGRYVGNHEAGTEPIPKLLEYAEYSASKLDHYVVEPRELKRHVATHRTYLTNLDAVPLEIGWPPPPADRLWWRVRELVAVVSRFAPEDVLVKLRRVRALARDRKRYERLREAALAREALDADTRERLRNGEVKRELERRRRERDRLEDALAAYPPA